MKVNLSYENTASEVEVDKNNDGTYLVKVNDKEYEVDARLISSRVCSLIIDNSSYDVFTFQGEDENRYLLKGVEYRVKVLDRNKKRVKGKSGGMAEGEDLIKSPMPGKIVKILVKEGDIVDPKTGIIVVEAMKMENELKTNIGGKVSKVMVEEGDTVEGGQSLILLVSKD